MKKIIEGYLIPINVQLNSLHILTQDIKLTAVSLSVVIMLQ